MAAYKWELLAKEASVFQSKLMPNPELDFEIENFAGSGSSRGFDSSESTISISQKVITAKKRKKRVKIAQTGKKIAEDNYLLIAADIVQETEKRFLKSLYIQKKILLREEMLRLSSQFLSKISRRVKAGRTPIFELSRAKISFMRNSIILEKLKKDLSASKMLLSSLWGKTGYDRFIVTGEMDIKSGLPYMNKLENVIEKNPEILLLLSKIRLHKNIIKLEKSLRIPDLTLTGGIRSISETGNSAFTFNFSLPVPLFNRNQGNIKRATFQLNRLEDTLKAVKITLRNRIIYLHKKMNNLHKNASTLKSTILPETKKIYKTVSEGYSMGKFDFLNILDAFRTQLEVQEDYLQTLYDYHKLNFEVNRITGLIENQLNQINSGDNNENK